VRGGAGRPSVLAHRCDAWALAVLPGGRGVPTIALFGATGRTGLEIVRQRLAAGVEIRALTRGRAQAAALPADVTTFVGSLDDPRAVAETLAGCDGACCVFGPRPPYRDVFCARATATVLAGMRHHGIARIACQTGAMVGRYPRNQTWPFQAMASVYRRQRREAAEDRVEQERLVVESGIEWTLVKPPRLTMGQPSGAIRAGTTVRIGLFSAVSRADLASFTLEELVRPRHVREVVFLRRQGGGHWSRARSRRATR
jgi:uncharacterized protein YbjT (DUF2867 family)